MGQDESFGGKIGRTVGESVPWWPEQPYYRPAFVRVQGVCTNISLKLPVASWLMILW